MMSHHTLFWMLLVCGVVAVSSGCAQKQELPRIVSMKIYQNPSGGPPFYSVGDFTEENLNALRQAGVNTVAMWTGSPQQPPYMKWQWWKDPESMGRVRQAALKCRQAGLKLYYMVYLNVPLDQYYEEVSFTPSRDAEGKGEYLPSLLDERYWEVYLHPRDRALAKLVAEGLGDGILLETECYRAGARFDMGWYDYGDVAFNLYLDANAHLKPEAAGLKPEERKDFLKEKNLLHFYCDWQDERIRKFVTQWKKDILAIAPQAQLGMYNPGRWYNVLTARALARGLNRTDRPMLLLDANTYGGAQNSYDLLPSGKRAESLQAYGDYMDHLVKQQWGVNAEIVFGLFTYGNPPYREREWWKDAPCMSSEGIRDFLREAIETGHGWWIWNEWGQPEKIIEDIRNSQKPPSKTEGS